MKGFLNHLKNRDVKFVSIFIRTDRFISTQRTCSIRSKNPKCFSVNAKNLFKCETCSKQYRESTEDLRPRFNHHRNAHKNSLKRKKVKHESCYHYYLLNIFRSHSIYRKLFSLISEVLSTISIIGFKL